MKQFLYISLILFVEVSPVFGQNPFRVNNIEKVKAIVESYTHELGFSGNILIGQGDSIIFRHESGYANFENGIRNSPDTKFRLASLTKQFTAAALLILEQQGKVNFDNPLSEYLPKLKEDIGSQITIHQILSHSSGLERDIESLSDQELGQTYLSLDEIIDLVNKSKLLFKPGSKWSYSNLGYALAASVIENITHLSYGNAMRKLIFEPLSMKNTNHEISAELVMNRGNGYVALPDRLINARYEDKSYVIGAGSIYSTTDDLFIWSREIMNGDILTPLSRERLFTQHAGNYGYGWFLGSYVWPPVSDQTTALNPNHDGGCPGFESKVSILTKHDLVIIILSNKLPSHINEISNKISNTCLGFEDESLAGKNGFQKYFDVLFAQGIDSVVSLQKAWKSADSKDKFYTPARADIFLIGRGYGEAMEYDKAIKVMDYLISQSPKWTYPYLFKGIYLEALGKAENAALLFKKVLEIDPLQSNAINHLEKLRLKN